MDIQTNIINKVAASGLVSLDLATLLPTEKHVLYDIKEHLFHGLILKEKDFREAIKNINWADFKNQYVALTCSADAVIPNWAYMLLTLSLHPYAKEVFFGSLEQLNEYLLQRAIDKLDLETYRDQRVVIKGCGEINIPVSAYVAVTQKLGGVVKTLMYGEPCSTVPLFKRKD